ncbi:pyridoxine/pyridoxamine 5'-phosphate oxidase [Pseudactinotalea sp. Z1732]|uniref:pyridoxine/pyridoxamine 5'-phosphate oxidase n=1 Tax=Pseudactinotalea sp. Z1732 TaxID=3413026 RepID=UPI003C7D73C7
MRQWLRALPTFPGPLPEFDPGSAPTDPVTLFTTWLREAAGAGVAIPHAAVLSTADEHGRVSGRTLILKDLHASGWVFATQCTSPKGQDMAANPYAALTFFWPAVGRQVRVQGGVGRLFAEAGAADFLARPPGSRAACRTGAQSQPLGSRQEYWDAYAQSLAEVEADPDLVAPHWAAYAIRPEWVEFWQATTDRGQVRLRYTAADGAWTSGLRWP